MVPTSSFGPVEGVSVVADCVLDQPVMFGTAALSRALTLNEYWVSEVRPEATYVVPDCQELLFVASFVHSK